MCQESCDGNKKQGSRTVISNSSLMFELLVAEDLDEEDLVEVEVLKEALNSIPGPTARVQPSIKKKS